MSDDNTMTQIKYEEILRRFTVHTAQALVDIIDDDEAAIEDVFAAAQLIFSLAKP